jgi:putative aldouronate transport system permease protein
MVEERTLGSVLFDIFNYAFLAIVSLLCILPFVHILAVSLSGYFAVRGDFVTLWPIDFTTVNYEEIVRDAQFRASFLISVARVLGGTAITLLITPLAAYPLSLERPGFPGQQVAKVILILCMFFSGGLIPFYLVITGLGLTNTLWALILPGTANGFFIIIMLNYFRGLPREISEAAMIDGASHLDILFRIYLPLSRPVLATLALFSAVNHWNSWFDGILFMRDVSRMPLTSYLQMQIIAATSQHLNPLVQQKLQLTHRGLVSAQVFVALIPILCVYPFLQRYFIHGLTLGSVKG